MKKSRQKALSPIAIIRQAALVLAMAIALPFAVHLIPVEGSVPVGARLLPVFLAPLIALYFFRPAIVLPAAALAPILNFMVTGQPQASLLFGMVLELTVFTLVCHALIHKVGWRHAAALLGIVSAKVFSIVFLGAGFSASFAIAWPGIALLVAANLLMNRFSR